MKKEKTMAQHTNDKLVQQFRDWQNLENDTLRLAEDLQKKTSNPFIQLIMEVIKRDSEKHKVMQQFVIDALTKEAVHLSPEELIPLSEVLEKHITAEAKSMALANACAVAESKDYFVDFVVEALMEDEAKHHSMLKTLAHIKGAVYQYGQAKEKHLTDAFR
jgi:MoxR-like ATPase